MLSIVSLIVALTSAAVSAHTETFANQDYRDALTKSILFFEGQRSGKLPSNQRMSWRRNSALSDGSAANVDLVGGYYDAGDNVKFGLPMAFTATMLSWSVIEFGGVMKDELQHAKEAIKWGTDYLLKATAKEGTVYVQVGDAYKDHSCWERPEDMDTPRTVYKIDKDSPGTEVAAETAAALAAASLVFRKTNPSYSQTLIRRAIKVFEFADKYRGSYVDKLRNVVCPFYCSYSGYEDELLWGAAWLFKATRNDRYLKYIEENGQTLGAGEYDNVFGWDNKHAGARLLLSKGFLVSKVDGLRDYKTHADNFICSLLPGVQHSSTYYTPGGLIFKMGNDNMQYVTSSAFLLLTYAKYLTISRAYVDCGGTMVTPGRLRRMAKRQVDYILGDNPMKMSYMVGYGKTYPLRIHHRASSLPSVAGRRQKISCKTGYSVMSSRKPNPNILVGAVVGGPDRYDAFHDIRSDYQKSEPSTYINAPLVGALAYFAHAYHQL